MRTDLVQDCVPQLRTGIELVRLMGVSSRITRANVLLEQGGASRVASTVTQKFEMRPFT